MQRLGLVQPAAKGGLTPRSTNLAYLRIKEKILDNVYPPGAQVLEQDIAAELDLSRTPVREALVRLQQDGLLQIVPRHGVRISVLSPADMREIYEIFCRSSRPRSSFSQNADPQKRICRR